MLKKLSLISSILLVSSLMSDATMEEDLGGFDNEEAKSEVSTDLDGFGEDLDGFGDDEIKVDDTLHPKSTSSLSLTAYIKNYLIGCHLYSGSITP